MKLNLEEYFYPTPGSEQEKDIVIFARRHWASLLGQIILSTAMLIIPLAIVIILQIRDTHFYQGISRNFIVVGASIYYLVALTFSFTAWISYYYDLYIVTKDTIIDITQIGFFGRKISQLSLLRVQDVSSNIKGILPTLFAYGDVLIETAGERSETFLLEAVSNPQEFAAKVLELHNKMIEGEGRRKQLMEGEGVMAPAEKDFSDEPQKEKPQEQKTPYQEQLQKEIEETQKSVEPEAKNEQGEVSKDDLNKGGEVKF